MVDNRLSIKLQSEEARYISLNCGEKAVKTLGKYKLAVTRFSSYPVKVLNAPHLLAVG